MLVASGPLLSAQEPALVRYLEDREEREQRNDYFVDLLRLALTKTEAEFGPFRLQPVYKKVPQGRLLRMLSADETVDVLWSMTSRSREEHLRPVRIPLGRGFIGYRLLVIRSEDREEFAAIESIEQLAEKVAGQGSSWPDTTILRHNGLPVTTSGYESLFTMLRHGRVDYIPRALNEPWAELALRPELGLVVEPTLVLHYPAANYFFVGRHNQALAQRLKRGLELALADGSFEQLFFNHPSHQVMFSKGRFDQRKVLSLENPLLPDSVPLQREALWWKPKTMTESESQ
ncbi:substrate-binding periplasmic protein [Marinimicrobium locisalis]|uniref:substrate-binding periplasmic protein n=1 Tax=Marinimicrobium locisalis TaxID=546022 RepID=UPI003221A881